MLARDRTVLLVVDVQEGFRPAIDGFDAVASATARLVQGATVLDIPVLVTEQYPKGLGGTVAEVAAVLGEETPRLAKTSFSATEAEGFDLRGRDQVLVCGIEAHICVHQTVQRLREDGLDVELVTDAVASRSDADRSIGLQRALDAGARHTTVEMALFELLGGAGTTEFSAVQEIIK